MKIKANDYSDGEILKILREWNNLTQEDLAKKIGKNKYFNDYETELYIYNMRTLRKIAKELDLEIIIQKKK